MNPHRPPPSLRRLLAILLGALAVLVGALILVASLQARGANAQTRAENRRTTSFLVADGLRQSSNDLTNMVRLYVASGQPRYRAYYDEILAIRGGTRPARATTTARSGTACSPPARASCATGRRSRSPPRCARRTSRRAEFHALQASLNASNGLAEVERDGDRARRAAHPARGGRGLLRRRAARLPAPDRRQLPRRQGPHHALDRPLHRPRRRAHAARGAARAHERPHAVGHPDRDPRADRARRRRRARDPHPRSCCARSAS